MHRHHSLAVVLIDFGIYSVTCDTADVGVILVAYLVFHELHHLILDGVALCLLCQSLHVARVLAHFLIVVSICRAPAFLITGEQTVNHGVGEASDGRGEVGVIVER